MGRIVANIVPVTTVDNPAARMRFEVVTFIFHSLETDAYIIDRRSSDRLSNTNYIRQQYSVQAERFSDQG